MRTNIVLDDQLIQEALRLSQNQTKKGVIHEALQLFVRTKKRKPLSELIGKIQFSEDYDYKKLRQDR